MQWVFLNDPQDAGSILINFDNAVDVVDIITLINLVLYPENDFLQDADLNEDGILSIIDIILLVNIILDN